MTEEGVPVPGSEGSLIDSLSPKKKRKMLRPADWTKPNREKDEGSAFILTRDYCSTGDTGSECNKDQLPLSRHSEIS